MSDKFESERELLIDAQGEIEQTINRMFAWRKQLNQIAEAIDGDIVALKELNQRIEIQLDQNVQTEIDEASA